MTFETRHGAPPADVTAVLLDGGRLAYASDYVSFSGADEHSRVAHAIDTRPRAARPPGFGRLPARGPPVERTGLRRAFPVEVRRIIYTTNALECLAYQLRKIT